MYSTNLLSFARTGGRTSLLSSYFEERVANEKPYTRPTPSPEPASNTGGASTGQAANRERPRSPANEASELTATQPAKRTRISTPQVPRENEPSSFSQQRARRQRKTKRKDQIKVSREKASPASSREKYTRGGRTLRNTKARASRMAGSSIYIAA